MEKHDGDNAIDLAGVPKELHETFLAIVALTDEFCKEFLDRDWDDGEDDWFGPHDPLDMPGGKPDPYEPRILKFLDLRYNNSN